MRRIKRRIVMLFLIFVALLLVSCGVNDKSTGSDSKNENNGELPDDIPKDFPFPDSIGNVLVSSAGTSEDGKRYTIAFSHDEDREELYNIMKAYLEDKGCEGEEVSGQYICIKNEDHEHLEGTKINIDDTIASVVLSAPPKK